jgi:hypothetical protein
MDPETTDGGTKRPTPGRIPRPWLLQLGTRQEERGGEIVQIYRDSRQMTYIFDRDELPAIDSAVAPATKKADRETGEDEKGF